MTYLLEESGGPTRIGDFGWVEGQEGTQVASVFFRVFQGWRLFSRSRDGCMCLAFAICYPEKRPLSRLRDFCLFFFLNAMRIKEVCLSTGSFRYRRSCKGADAACAGTGGKHDP
ncbi:unnamed protein product, partial [Ectocarpus sp. 12 AP-2014]